MPKTPEWLKNDGKEYTNRPPADAVPSPTGQGGPRVNAEEHNRRLLLRENCSNSSPWPWYPARYPPVRVRVYG